MVNFTKRILNDNFHLGWGYSTLQLITKYKIFRRRYFLSSSNYLCWNFIKCIYCKCKIYLDPVKTGIKHILIATIYIQLFLTPSSQKVIIEDVVKNSALQVSNLPYGYVIVLSLTSQLEYYTTQAIENAFTTPNSLRINETGLGFGMSTHLRMMEAMPINDDILESFGLYYYNCLKPELYMKRKLSRFIYE